MINRMLKPLTAAAFATTLIAASPVTADLSGTWRTSKNPQGGFVDMQIYRCGSSFCGRTLRAYGNAKIVPNGQQVIRGLKKKSSRYTGQVYVVQVKRWVTLKVNERNANNVAVKACLGPICRSGTWSRL